MGNTKKFRKSSRKSFFYIDLIDITNSIDITDVILEPGVTDIPVDEIRWLWKIAGIIDKILLTEGSKVKKNVALKRIKIYFMKIEAKNVEEYYQNIDLQRKQFMEKLLQTIDSNLPKGFENTLSYGMPGWVVPLSYFGDGYHCKKDTHLLL